MKRSLVEDFVTTALRRMVQSKSLILDSLPSGSFHCRHAEIPVDAPGQPVDKLPPASPSCDLHELYILDPCKLDPVVAEKCIGIIADVEEDFWDIVRFQYVLQCQTVAVIRAECCLAEGVDV